MKAVFAFSFFLVLNGVFAKGKDSAQEHRHHEKHEHGVGELAIAFEGKIGKIEFRTPAESILGFEHRAKSAADKKHVEMTIAEFEKNISTSIRFEEKLKCQLKKEKIEALYEKKGNHSDFTADFSVVCEQAVAGSTINFDFTAYKRLTDLDVTVLVDSLQKTLELKAKSDKLELK